MSSFFSFQVFKNLSEGNPQRGVQGDKKIQKSRRSSIA